MRRTLIVNPNASRVTDERIAEVEARLRPEETLRTEHRGHATELARDGRGDEVWVLGGDGVVNEALNGIRDGVALGSFPPEARTSWRAPSARGSGASPSAGSTDAGSRSRQASASTPRWCASWRPSNARRAAAAPAISSTGAPWRGGSSVDPNRGSRSWGRARRGGLRLERRGLHVRRAAAAALPARRPVRAGPRLRRAGSRDAALVGEPVHCACWRAAGWPVQSGVLTGHDLDRIEVHCDVPLPLQADGEDLGDVREALFEAERDARTTRWAPVGSRQSSVRSVGKVAPWSGGRRSTATARSSTGTAASGASWRGSSARTRRTRSSPRTTSSSRSSRRRSRRCRTARSWRACSSGSARRRMSATRSARPSRRGTVFPEVPRALEQARARGWRLCILSNTDRDFIDASMTAIGVPFDRSIVAVRDRLVQAGSRPLAGVREGGRAAAGRPRRREPLPRRRADVGARHPLLLDQPARRRPRWLHADARSPDSCTPRGGAR